MTHGNLWNLPVDCIIGSHSSVRSTAPVPGVLVRVYISRALLALKTSVSTSWSSGEYPLPLLYFHLLIYLVFSRSTSALCSGSRAVPRRHCSVSARVVVSCVHLSVTWPWYSALCSSTSEILVTLGGNFLPRPDRTFLAHLRFYYKPSHLSQSCQSVR